jgi:hypothetical protein
MPLRIGSLTQKLRIILLDGRVGSSPPVIGSLSVHGANQCHFYQKPVD